MEQVKKIAFYGVHRDPDVLDTWFSSALWPFATLGWPQDNPPRNGEVAARSADGGVEASPEALRLADGSLPLRPSGAPPRSGEDLSAPSLLARHYPNDLLISGFDILFFWCARMAMMGMKLNEGQVPWKRLYLHGLVRAADGQKMSKSKGNVVDPLVLIDKYGADALRFFMSAMESQGRDVKMDERRVEGYRNFATKLWNAARFCQANGIGASTTLEAPPATLAVNKWIIGEVVETLAALDKALADLRFDAAANAIYHFVWDEFCDRYLEAIKVDLRDDTREVVEAMDIEASQGSGERQIECRTVAGWVLDQIFVMLHPFMPFVTEELWAAMGPRESELIVAVWPEPAAWVDSEAKAEVMWVEGLIREIRQIRNDLGLPPRRNLQLHIENVDPNKWQWLRRNTFNISRRTNINIGIRSPQESLNSSPVGKELLELQERKGITPEMRLMTIAEGKVQIPYDGCLGFLDPGPSFDFDGERSRIEKAIDASTKEARSLQARLANPAFVEKAKPEAVEKARADHAAHAAEAERLAAALARLG